VPLAKRSLSQVLTVDDNSGQHGSELHFTITKCDCRDSLLTPVKLFFCRLKTEFPHHEADLNFYLQEITYRRWVHSLSREKRKGMNRGRTFLELKWNHFFQRREDVHERRVAAGAAAIAVL